MVTFQVPLKQEAGEPFRFSVAGRSVLLAGSRHGSMPHDTCCQIIQQFHHLGFRFFVGCAAGIDRCFREARAVSPYHKDCVVACAFSSRVHPARSLGLYASVVVPPGLPPAAALRRSRCTTGCCLQICSVCCGATGPCPIPSATAGPATMNTNSKEEMKMKEKKKIPISIHPVEDRPGDYLATFRSEFLDVVIRTPACFFGKLVSEQT